MATYFARKSGNINATDVWATTPSGTADAVTFDPSDILVSNSFTITVNVSVTVAQVTNTVVDGSTVGGSFSLSNGVTLTADVLGGNARCVSFALTTPSSATVVGNISTSSGTSSGTITNSSSGTLNIIGSIGSPTTNGAYTVVNSSGGTININGNVSLTTTGAAQPACVINYGTGGTINITGNITASPSGNNTAAVTMTTGFINITGNVTGGSSSIGLNMTGGSNATIVGSVTGGGSSPGATNAGNGTLSITGNVTGGTGSGSAGVTSGSGSGNLTVNGTLQATTNAAAVSSGAGINYLTGPFLCASNGRVANACSIWRWNSTLNPNTYITIPTSNLSTTRNFVTPENVTGMPATNNVRLGVTYADGGLTGTCAVPPSGAVAFGVPVDNTTGSALLTPADFWNYSSSLIATSGSIGERLKNCATISSVGQQLSDALS